MVHMRLQILIAFPWDTVRVDVLISEDKYKDASDSRT